MSSTREMPEKIEFYDISYTGSKLPWSPFTARTYLALKLLDIPHERHLVPMVDIAKTLSGFGLVAREGGRHTLPMLAVTETGKQDRTYLTDSADIAKYLQDLYVGTGGRESMSLFPELSEQVQKEQGVKTAQELAHKAHKALVRSLNEDERWLSITAPVHHILEPASQQYFLEDRAKSWGKPMHEIDAQARQLQDKVGGIEKVFEHAMQPYAELYANTQTKFLTGDRAVYADIIVLAALQWYRCSNEKVAKAALKAVGHGRLEQLWNDSHPLWRD